MLLSLSLILLQTKLLVLSDNGLILFENGRNLPEFRLHFDAPEGGVGLEKDDIIDAVTRKPRQSQVAQDDKADLEDGPGDETQTTTQDITTTDISTQEATVTTEEGGISATETVDEEELQKLIEDNEEQEKVLVDSLESVIGNLSEIVTHISITTTEQSSENSVKISAEDKQEDAEEESSTLQDDLIDLAEHETVVNEKETILNDFITRHALSGLQLANLTASDISILTALLELEILKGEQKDTREEIKLKLQELELLLSTKNGTLSHVNPEEIDSINNIVNFSAQLPRRGKTIPPEDVIDTKVQTVNLFENIQKQLFSLLDERHRFLQLVSQKINTELSVIQQTVSFLQQLVNLKLDQGVMLLGADNPILNILQSGSTSVFLMLTRFFQAVESVLGLRDEFLRTFSFDSTALQEAKLLERIQELKLDRILPTKIRFLMNVHTNSDKLGRMLEQIFSCVGQIVEAKIKVIESVGRFFENKIDFLSGFSGPSTRPEVIVEAVQTGNLFELLNFGPVSQDGVPGISDRELDKTIEGILRDTNPQVPVLGSAKPLLVDHRILGMLSGGDRHRFVNRYLSRKLSTALEHSHNVLHIDRGQTVLQSLLPAIHLGTPCTNDIFLGRSRVSAVVTRQSRVSATSGVTIYSHSPTSLDLFGHARLYTNVNINGYMNAKFGHNMFGKCFPKFAGSSPISLSGSAVVEAHTKVVVRHVRLETRVVKHDLVSEHVVRGHVGETHPHLVFNFDIKVDGTVTHFDINKLKLTGCELRLLGIQMFSHCGLLEALIRRQMEKMMRDTFPLRDRELLYKLEKMLRRRLGEEIALPLVLTDVVTNGGVDTVIRKTGDLIALNIKFFNMLTMFTADMNSFNSLDNNQ